MAKKKAAADPKEIHSPQCVAAIVHMFSLFDWASEAQKVAKNWKRIKKETTGEATFRQFENKVDASLKATVTATKERITGVFWVTEDSRSKTDKQLEAVSKATGASIQEVKDLAAELEKDYEPCIVCGTMLKKGVMEKCDKCGKIACKRCLKTEGTEIPAALLDVYGVVEGSKLHWCADCLGETEKQYVDSVTYDELPLLMGRTWLVTDTEAHLLGRLNKGD